MFGDQVNRSNASRRKLIRTYAGVVRNRVFLRKYCVVARRFGKKPGFLVGVRPGLLIKWLGDRVQFQFYEDPETIDLAVSNVSEWFNRHV